MTKKRKGFTLVELLVVIAILAILATVSVVGYTAFIERAHQSNAETEAAQIRELIRAQVLSGKAFQLGTAKVSGDSNNSSAITNAVAVYVAPFKDTNGKITYKLAVDNSSDASASATTPYIAIASLGTNKSEVTISNYTTDLAKLFGSEDDSSDSDSSDSKSLVIISTTSGDSTTIDTTHLYYIVTYNKKNITVTIPLDLDSDITSTVAETK